MPKQQTLTPDQRELQERAQQNVLANKLWTSSLVECQVCWRRWVQPHPVACRDLACDCGSTDTLRFQAPGQSD